VVDMAKPNIIGPAVVKYCDAFLITAGSPPAIEQVISHLNSLNLRFKESSIVSMFSTWRSDNGFKQKRGRKPKECTDTIQSEVVIKEPTVVQKHHVTFMVGNGKKWEVIRLGGDMVELKSQIIDGMTFETNLQKAFQNGYTMIEETA